jgi:hypothetical protein
VFFTVATAASYGLSFGLTQGQKSVLALGMSTRNLGAAFAPLFAITGIDERAIVMVALGVPMQTIFRCLRHVGSGAAPKSLNGVRRRPLLDNGGAA